MRLLDLQATADIDHHRLDPRDVQQVREHQPGRSGTDDADLRAADHCSSRSTASATVKAWFAAGTPQYTAVCRMTSEISSRVRPLRSAARRWSSSSDQWPWAINAVSVIML